MAGRSEVKDVRKVEKFARRLMDSPVELKFVYARYGSRKGTLTHTKRRCQMESCVRDRYGVRWPDGKITWPCAGGMKMRKDGQWQIM